MRMDERLRLTRRGEMARACCIEPVAVAFRGSGIGVLVVLQHFNGSDWIKGLIAAAAAGGLMLGPLAVMLAARLRVSVSRAAGCIFLAAIPGLIVAAAPGLALFAVGILLSVPLLGATVPLLTALWEQNAHASLRGRVFAQVTTAGAFASLLCAGGVALHMRGDAGAYRPVLLVFAAMIAVGAAAVLRIPSRAVERSHHHAHPLAALPLLWRDKLFGYMCIPQMLMGFANLATIPMRAEFAGSAVRGVGYQASVVLALTLVIPEAARLTAIPLWGRLFDRMNFMVLRISINMVFFLSMVLFFVRNPVLQVVGSICFGIAVGGASIAWNLWVTKLAPSEHTADYMAVHTFLTGVRGVVAPQLAYAALAVFSVPAVGAMGAGLVLLASLMLVPVIPRGRPG